MKNEERGFAMQNLFCFKDNLKKSVKISYMHFFINTPLFGYFINLLLKYLSYYLPVLLYFLRFF